VTHKNRPTRLLRAIGLPLAAPLLVLSAAAQPVQPVPTAGTPVANLLASAPHRDISNVLVTARLATELCTRVSFIGAARLRLRL
jgi:hypothetical protein